MHCSVQINLSVIHCTEKIFHLTIIMVMSPTSQIFIEIQLCNKFKHLNSTLQEKSFKNFKISITLHTQTDNNEILL